MKKLLTILFFLPLLINAQTYLLSYSITSAIPLEGKKAVFKGNSITVGVGASSGANQWTTLFCKAKGCTEVNNGISGQVLQSGGTCGNPVFDQTTIQTYDNSYGVLFIELGTNDVKDNNSNFTSSGYQTTLSTAVDYAHNTKGWPYNKIVLVTPTYMTTVGDGSVVGSCGVTTAADATRHIAYNTAVQNVATAKGSIYADVYTAMVNGGGNSLVNTDGIHPNDAGHATWATAIEAIPRLSPAPSPKYISGTTVINFTSVTNLSNASGIWTGTGGGSYGHTGLATLKLPASTDGWIAWKVVIANDGTDAILGFSTTNAQQGYASMNAGAYMTSGNLVRDDNGSVLTTGVSQTIGGWSRIFRKGSTGQVKLQTSVDGSAWTDVYTYAFSSTAILYIVTDINGTSGTLYYPQGFNIN